jgi:hypothetical protein
MLGIGLARLRFLVIYINFSSTKDTMGTIIPSADDPYIKHLDSKPDSYQSLLCIMFRNKNNLTLTCKKLLCLLNQYFTRSTNIVDMSHDNKKSVILQISNNNTFSAFIWLSSTIQAWQVLYLITNWQINVIHFQSTRNVN